MRPALLAHAIRLARRELRGGVAGLRVFIACLVLGVGAIAGIGSLAASLSAGIAGDARELLGGDVEAQLAYRPANAAEDAFLAQSGTLSEVASMRAMARANDGHRQSLIELKAVDDAYPLYGKMALSPAQTLGSALALRDGILGAVVDPAILGRLGEKIGDMIKIGEAALQIRATIAREPDAAASGLILGPRVMISSAALAETRLIQPGALVTYRYRLRLPAGCNACGLGAEGAHRVPRRGLGNPQLWPGLARFATTDRPGGAVLVARRALGAAGRRRRYRQCGARPHRRQDRDDRHPQMPGRPDPPRLHGLFVRDHGAGADGDPRCHRAWRAVAGRGRTTPRPPTAGLGPPRALSEAAGSGAHSTVS